MTVSSAFPASGDQERLDKLENSARAKGNPRANRDDSSTIRRTPTSELDNLLWRIRTRTTQEAKGGWVLAMTSCCRKTGVSTSLSNMAVRAADYKMGPVLLIDANPGSPGLHRNFRIKSKIGLSDILTGQIAPSEAVVNTKTNSLDLLPLGKPSTLQRSRMIPENYEELINWAKGSYQTVFIDLPMIDELRHGLLLARLADAAIVAVRSNAVQGRVVEDSIQNLMDDGVNVVGTVLMRKRFFAPKWLRG